MKKIRYVDAHQRLALEIVFIFLLPVLLFKWGIVPIQFRFPALVIVSLAVIAIIIREKWTLADLGFRKITKAGLELYTLATIILVELLYLYSFLLPLSPSRTKEFFLTLLVACIPISFFQEILYRGFLIHAMEKVYTDRVTICTYNGILFAILHIIYPFPAELLPLSFAAGFFASLIYMKERNIYLVTLSHAVLNFVALTLGIFVV